MWKCQKSAQLIDCRIIDRPINQSTYTLNYAAQNLAISVFNSMCLCAWCCVTNLWTRRAFWAAARANDCAAGTFVWPCEEKPPLFMFVRDVCGNTDVFSVNFFSWIRATFLHAEPGSRLIFRFDVCTLIVSTLWELRICYQGKEQEPFCCICPRACILSPPPQADKVRISQGHLQNNMSGGKI